MKKTGYQCILTIRDNKNKDSLREAIEHLKKFLPKEKGEERVKNMRNWIKIGEAKLTPNTLSNRLVLDENGARDYLFDNPAHIEPNLTMLCKEFDLKIGRVDLLAKDGKGQYVVIEIKIGKAIGQAIGQLMAYLFAFKFYFNREARGILFAPNFHPQSMGAFAYLKELGDKNIQLKYFNGRDFIFEKDKFNFTRRRPLTKNQFALWRKIEMS